MGDILGKSEITVPTSDDAIYLVNDADGSPSDGFITLANLFGNVPAPMVVKGTWNTTFTDGNTIAFSRDGINYINASHASGKLHLGAGGLTNVIILDTSGNVGFGKAPSSKIDIDLATEDLEIVDAGSAAATEQDWIQVEVGGVTGYIRVFGAK